MPTSPAPSVAAEVQETDPGPVAATPALPGRPAASPAAVAAELAPRDSAALAPAPRALVQSDRSWGRDCAAA